MTTNLGAVGDRHLRSGSSRARSSVPVLAKRHSRLKPFAAVALSLVVIVAAVAFFATPPGVLVPIMLDQRTNTASELPPMWYHAMAYDSQSDRIVLFGSPQSGVNETWVYDFDTNTWTNMGSTGAPLDRWGSGMTYDSQSDRVILWGGSNPAGFYPMNDTWAYDFESNGWTDMRPAAAPPGRFFLEIAYDSESDRVVTFDGREQWLLDDETWAYDFDTNTWSDMNPAQPPYADSSAMVYDSESDRVVLFGLVSEESSGWWAMTWVYDLDQNTWTRMYPSAQPPKLRFHAMAYDSQSDRVILFGGEIDMGPTSDETWAYDLDTNTWTNMNPATRPSARAWHAMAYDSQSDRVILCGGYDSGTGNNETWAYDFDTNTWTQMTPGPVIPEFGAAGLVIIVMATVCILVALRCSHSSSRRD